MSAFTQRLANILKADGTIQFHCSDRVIPYDIRTAGPQARTNVEDAYGFLLPTICVDDQGGARSAFAPSGTTEDQIAVWLLAERGGDGSGSDILQTVADRVIALLHRYQDPPTRAYLTYVSRMGQQYDPAPATGMLDLITFRAASVLMTART